MNPPLVQHALLPVKLPVSLVCLLAVVWLALWVLVHRLFGRARSLGAKMLVRLAAVAAGFLALLCVLDALQHVVMYATSWWVWPLALVGAVVVEALLALYGLERGIVPPRIGLALAALRVAMALLLVIMLAQPVRSVEFKRSLQRYVAVLLDTSASMRVADRQMTPSERVRMAEAVVAEAPRRPWRLEDAAAALAQAREKLAARIDWFAALREASPEARQKHLADRRRALRSAIDGLRQSVAAQAEALAEPLAGTLKLDESTRATLLRLKDRIEREPVKLLARAYDMLARGQLPAVARDPEKVAAPLREASAALVALSAQVAAAGEALDEAFYNSLPDPQKKTVDAVAEKTRLAIARQLLLGTEGKNGLLNTLGSNYGLRIYTFAAEPVETTTALLAKLDTDPRHDQAAELRTNLAAALEKVITEMPPERLAGVLVLTDGQHNVPTARVEAAARRLGLQDVPLCSIALGASARPPADAAIVSLKAPETIYKKDKVYLDADVKLDGLKGKTVRLTLYDGDVAVDAEEVNVESDSLRTRVQLSDEPSETGLHAYRVKVEKVEGEALAANNEHPLSVNVTDDQTRLLLIEERPRWEFRYLKNLFASRDPTVKLQYVVLKPDEIPGQPPRETIHASVTRPKDKPEATAPPENEAEWMKFDVIILGDVDPAAFRSEDLETIRKFVTERGGTLVVIAGPRYMPHAYADTPLADLIPVTFEKVDDPQAYVDTPEEIFHVELTPEGRNHVVTRLRVDPDENLEVWHSFPEIHWRHPILDTKEGAVVLAYALPPIPPDFLKPRREHEVPDEQTLLKRQAFIREHALLTVQNVALGRVMFLGFDRTWRLRYRVGDTYHHRFWGQVLRWATADKLPAGTAFVRLGTDRPRYGPHDPVRVRAKLTETDFSPIVSEKVTAVVYRDDRVVLRKKMAYVPNSQGIYTADLGSLDGGTYRVELEAPEARRLLARDNVEKVATRFFVEPATPIELVELAANRGLLERMATLTGGRVAEPPEAAKLLETLGPGTLVHRERRDWPFWDSWLVLALVVVFGGSEWFLRKRARLA